MICIKFYIKKVIIFFVCVGGGELIEVTLDSSEKFLFFEKWKGGVVLLTFSCPQATSNMESTIYAF